jgi:hypothetical protein
MVWMDDQGISLTRYRTLTIGLGLLVVVLAVVAVFALTWVLRPGVSSAIVAGIEADAVRWSAVGASYAPDYQAIAQVNAARWQALGKWYATRPAQD